MKTLDWCRPCGQTDEGDAEISLGCTLAEHNRTGTESVIRSEADRGRQRQTDTQSLSKSGPSVVSQMDVDPPPRAPVGVAGRFLGGGGVVGEAAARR